MSVAFGDGLEGVGSGVGVLPGEIASGPHLQHQDDEHDDDGAEVDESIFFAMGLEDEIVLNLRIGTFHRSVCVILHQLINF